MAKLMFYFEDDAIVRHRRVKILESNGKKSGRVARRQLGQRKRLLWAALGYFGEKGVEGGSLSEIAERADVAVGTLYSYFPSREALIDALDAELLNVFRQWMSDSTRTGLTPLERIAARVRLALGFAVHAPAWHHFMIRNGFWLAQRGLWPSPQVKADVDDALVWGKLQMSQDFAVVTIVGLFHGYLLRMQCRTVDANYAEQAAAHLLTCLGAAPNEAAAAANAPLARPNYPDMLMPSAA
jgi:AcrR family transcriptional regulator